MLLVLYTLRGLRARFAYTLPVFLIITATTAIITGLLGTERGFRDAIEHAGDPRNVVMLAPGAGEQGASLRPALLQQVKVAPGVLTEAGVQLVSPEYVTTVPVQRPDKLITRVLLRGVDPVALKVHPAVQVDGALPPRGEPGLVIGKSLVGKYVGFQPGQHVLIGRKSWPITGVLTAQGTKYESEVWCDRTMLMSEVKATDLSVITATLTDEGEAQAQFAARFAKNKEAEVVPEPAFLRRQLQDFGTYLNILSALMAVLAVGAIIGGSNAMHASFLARRRELGVLMAIGYTRGRIVMLVLLESLTLSLSGGALGLLLSLSINGRQFTQSEAGISYAARIAPAVLGGGAMVAGAIGVLAALLAVVYALRMHALAALSGD